VQPGDEVELVGFPKPTRTGPEIEFASWTVLKHGASPRPIAIKVPVDADMHGHLVSLEGLVQYSSEDPYAPRIEFAGTDISCTAISPFQLNAKRQVWPLVPSGSRVRVTGLCTVKSKPLMLDSSRVPLGIQIWPRSPSDIVILERPPVSQEVFWLRISLAALFATVLWGLWSWVRSRKLLLQQKQEREKMAAIASERQRIAHDLHDTLAQGLTVVSVRLDAAKYSLNEQPGRTEEHLNIAHTQVRESLAAARNAIEALRPAILDKHTLDEAAKIVGQRLWPDGELNYQVVVSNPLPKLPPFVEHNALYILQEALTNTAKHANAKQVTVKFEITNHALHLSIVDDGESKALISSSTENHHGLASMKERAESCGGRLQVLQQQLQGTKIEAILPYD
jgi:signal transduction histidine kinase